MRYVGLVAFLATATVCRATDLAKLPANTWVERKYTTEQPYRFFRW
jgi:hypothetical protein